MTLWYKQLGDPWFISCFACLQGLILSNQPAQCDAILQSSITMACITGTALKLDVHDGANGPVLVPQALRMCQPLCEDAKGLIMVATMV